jgi:entericidin B
MEQLGPDHVFYRHITRAVPLREIFSVKLKALTLIAALFGMLFVASCANTIRGVGQDTANSVNAVQGAGKKVVKAAQ